MAFCHCTNDQYYDKIRIRINLKRRIDMNVSESIRYVGVNDHQVDLFEGQYRVPNGMSYNSYVILDEKIAVMDTVDKNFTHEWLDHIQNVLQGRKPDYLIVQHMEPDHAANVANFMKFFPETTIVSSAKAFAMMEAFFGTPPHRGGGDEHSVPGQAHPDLCNCSYGSLARGNCNL